MIIADRHRRSLLTVQTMVQTAVQTVVQTTVHTYQRFRHYADYNTVQTPFTHYSYTIQTAVQTTVQTTVQTMSRLIYQSETVTDGHC